MPGLIHHVSITCTDIAASESFYLLLGFKPIKVYEDNTCKIVLLEGDNSHIELFHFKLANVEKLDAKKIESIGLTHIAIKTKSLEITKETLVNAGHNCQDNKEARMGGFSYFFSSDPDGNLVELIKEKS